MAISDKPPSFRVNGCDIITVVVTEELTDPVVLFEVHCERCVETGDDGLVSSHEPSMEEAINTALKHWH